MFISLLLIPRRRDLGALVSCNHIICPVVRDTSLRLELYQTLDS